MSDRTANLKPWKKGQSGNPGGRPKSDVAALLSRQIFDENQAEIIAGLVKALQRGDAAVFKALADRAFGRLPQPVEHSGSSGSDGGPIEIILGCEKPPWMPK